MENAIEFLREFGKLPLMTTAATYFECPMPALPSVPPRPLPAWLKLLASVLVLGHLSILGLRALASQSGPWPTPYGSFQADPPMFAQSITSVVLPVYLQPLQMTHNYHFETNKTPPVAAYFEVHLKDSLGVVKTLKFPDEKANFWVRHRQQQLALWLAADEPLQPRGSEKIAAPRQKADEVEFWEMAEQGTLRLKKLPEHLAPRDPQFMKPSERAKMLAASYLRYLCREHGASSAELVRCSRETIMPIVLFMPEPPTEQSLMTLKSHFGEYRREK